MSGNAALSAARKRRASSSPMGAGAGGSSSTPSSAYYNRTTPTTQQLMNQTFPEHNNKPQYTLPSESGPNVPINIYENIELIKQQITARTNTIQTQGKAIPVEKLRILQKQNEIQTQILKQKMAIAQQMEQSEQEQFRQQDKDLLHQRGQMSISSANEPEFVYEKGIPRKNPNYKSPAEIEEIKKARAHTQAEARARNRPPAQAPPPAQAQAPAPVQAQAPPPSQMTPFVSMITDTGVIPPPIVILKYHNSKLEEHDNVIHDIIHQLGYLHSQLDNYSSKGLPVINEEGHRKSSSKDTSDADAEADPESEPEQELLMEVVMNDLTNSREFVEGIVDKIVNDTNLSEVIMKIEPLVKENQELRSLIHSQQQMMNEMNTMLLRLLNTNVSSSTPTQLTEADESQPVVFQDDGLDIDGLYMPEMEEMPEMPEMPEMTEMPEMPEMPEMTEIVLSNYAPVELISEANNNIDADTEPAYIIDLESTTDAAETEATEAADETEAAAETEATEAAAETEAADETEAAEAAAETEAADEVEATEATDDAYSEMPHFPEQIALIVNEI
jgi:hypothetical protein